MSETLESAVFMGKNCSDNWQSIKNTKDLTMKQMFVISAELVSEQDEISGVKTIDWENHSWKYLSLIGDERVINLQRTKVFVFLDSVLCFGKILENTQSNDAWEQRLGWLKSSSKYRKLDRIRVEYLPRIQYVAAQSRSQVLLLRSNETLENFKGRSSSCRCSTTSHGDQETMKKNASQMLDSFLYMQRSLEQDNGHLLVLVQRKSCIPSVQIVHKTNGTESQRR